MTAGVNPSPMKRAFVCPLCGEPIDAMEPHETAKAPAPEGWVPNLSVAPEVNAVNFAVAQNLAANEALIWSHISSMHTMREAVLALGQARNALMEIREVLRSEDYAELKVDLIEEHVLRGLDGK